MKDILEFSNVLHACSRLATKECDRYFLSKDCEVGYLQFALLLKIGELEEAPRMSIRALGAALHLDRTTINRNADTLVDRGLLVKRTAGYDNRSKAYYLTPLGRECVERNLPHYYAAAQMIYGLSSLPRRIKEMKELLTKLINV